MGPYYSHMLLNAVISHSIRWGKNDVTTRGLLEESYDGGAVFGKHARSMLFEDLSKGACSTTTVQTLLLLSAQECSFGNSTQAWTYSGLAFRLMDHLGICLDGQRYPGSVSLSDEDIEIRRRVFWSGYFWDKMISLYLGRSPSLQLSASSPPQIMCKFHPAYLPAAMLTILQLMIPRKMSSGFHSECHLMAETGTTLPQQLILLPAF